MKNILLLAALTLTLVACKKNDGDVTPVDAEYFTFGLSGGFCGSCYHYYQVRGQHLYQDSLYTSAGWVFKTVPMSQAKYNLAIPLTNSFPSYLSTHPNTTIGCSGCADQQVFLIEIMQNGVKTHWYIDDIDSVQPTAIKPYLAQMRSVISALAN